MHNPDNVAIDVEEVRAWLRDYKHNTGRSWHEISRETQGFSETALSTFSNGNYAGNNANVAKAVWKFRQTLEVKAKQRSSTPIAPGYFETPTALVFRSQLILAHTGEITVIATAPGTGKTMAIRQYAASVSNCWVVTAEPATSSLRGMVSEVLHAVDGSTKGGWVKMLSRQVAAAVRGRDGLIVVDEANHLDVDAIEQLRSWHDTTGVGLCLAGNEELLARIRGANRASLTSGRNDQFARLAGRLAGTVVQDMPRSGDVDAFCDAWSIVDEASRTLLGKIAMTPGLGGLREIAMIVKAAGIMAADDGRAPSYADLRDAQSRRHSKHVRA